MKKPTPIESMAFFLAIDAYFGFHFGTRSVATAVILILCNNLVCGLVFSFGSVFFLFLVWTLVYAVFFWYDIKKQILVFGGFFLFFFAGLI